MTLLNALLTCTNDLGAVDGHVYPVCSGERDKLRKNGGKLALLERRFRASKKWTQILIATVQRRISEGLIAAETLNKALEESDQRMTRVEQALSDLNRVVNYLLKQPPP